MGDEEVAHICRGAVKTSVTGGDTLVVGFERKRAHAGVEGRSELPAPRKVFSDRVTGETPAGARNS